MIKQGFPATGIPFVAPDGTISTTWYLLLQSLWQRTGSGKGIDTVLAINNIAAAADDLALALGSESAAVPPTVSSALSSLQQSVADLSVLIAATDSVRQPVSDPLALMHDVMRSPVPDPFYPLLLT